MKLLCRFFGSDNLPFRQKKAIKFKIWTLFACLKEIYQFLGRWFGKLLSVLANTFCNPSVSQKKTPVRSFRSGCLTFKQKTQSNLKFGPYWHAPKKLTNFGVADLESSIQFWPKHSTTLQCDKMKLLWRVFGSANLPFRQKKAIKFEVWTLFACSKEIDQFLGGWFGKLLSGLAQTFQDPLVSQNETPVKVFWLSIFTFQTKESNKIWNLDPLRLLERNLPILGGLIWKAAFSFGQHIPQPFSVTKKNSCGKLSFRLLPFQTKNSIKFEIWTLVASSKEIDQFWDGWFGKQHSVLAQCLHGPLVSQNELL